MNTKFADATTGMAFAMVLSKRMCNSLLRLYLHGNDSTERSWVIGVDGLNGLHRKGLVYWHQDEDGRSNGFGGLTEAGALTAMLLIEAGLTVEVTNTPMVIKRMGWEDERKARKKETLDAMNGAYQS